MKKTVAATMIGKTIAAANVARGPMLPARNPER
jgi:hypothetical protein